MLERWQRFCFSEDVEAVKLSGLFGQWPVCHAPADHARTLYSSELLGEVMLVSREQVFIVEDTYQANMGLAVLAKAEDGSILTLQFIQRLGSKEETPYALEIEPLK